MRVVNDYYEKDCMALRTEDFVIKGSEYSKGRYKLIAYTGFVKITKRLLLGTLSIEVRSDESRITVTLDSPVPFLYRRVMRDFNKLDSCGWVSLFEKFQVIIEKVAVADYKRTKCRVLRRFHV